MRQQHVRHISVVLNEIALRDLQFRPKQLVEIRKLDGAATEFDFALLDLLRNIYMPPHAFPPWCGSVFGRMIIRVALVGAIRATDLHRLAQIKSSVSCAFPFCVNLCNLWLISPVFPARSEER